MMVYSAREQAAVTTVLLARLDKLLGGLSETVVRHPQVHSQVVELLIEFGRLEAGLVDALFPDWDDTSELSRWLRRLSLALGRLFRHSWNNCIGPDWESSLRQVQQLFAPLQSLELPETVPLRVPEGYAYYALYPETYLAAAERFYQELRPERAVCLGIRSIGTSLAGVVGGTLQTLGCRVESYTLRPRGHPFERRLALSPALEGELRAWADAWFLIIDEGPGLSGSSFGGTAQALSERGIPDRRIGLFPSWEPDGSQLLSAAARAVWRRHRKFTAAFEQVWIESGRLADPLVEGPWRDLSAGAWRALFYRDEADCPAVQPQHERRKYLCRKAGADPARGTGLLLKFAGLAGYGRAALERAERLAEHGFAPPALALQHGFLATSFVPGRPLTQGTVDTPLLDTMARYLAFLRRGYATGQAPDYAALTVMITVNTSEGLGPEWAARLAGLERHRAAVCGETTVAVDGRMLPHEWLQTPIGYLKTDGVDHHNDHFFPGCQDSAWDIAGCTLEFNLDEQALEYLVERYRRLADDRTVSARLPFYRVAYAAYRLGYATLAAQTLGATPEARRFAALSRRYAAALQQAIVEAL